MLTAGLCAVSLVMLTAGERAGLRAGDKKGKTMTLKVGDKAPSFEAVDDQGKTWNSSEHIGKKIIVLYFFPAALTGGWTLQACGFRDETENLGKGVEVVGVSGDAVENQKLFKSDKSLNFTLLSDEKGQLAQKFGIPTKPGGVFKYKDDSGKVHELKRGVTISRYTVIIDRSGTIAAIDPVPGNPSGDAKRVAEIVRGLEKK
jgi:thioredoxin-dependent peroxiredoxin